MRSQGADGLVRKGAVGSPAVGHDTAVAGEFAQPLLQLLEWNRDGTGNVRSLVLRGGSDIDHNQRLACLESCQQLITTDRFEAFPRTQVSLDEVLYARQPLSRQGAQSHPEPVDDRRGEPITHASAVPGCGHESGILQDLEVPAGVGD